MNKTLGKYTKASFKFFESTGLLFMRSSLVRVALLFFFIVIGWQLGGMSINSVISRADTYSCEGVGQANCPAGYSCADGKNGNGTCEKDNPDPAPAPGGNPSECSFTGTRDEGCECNTQACIGVMWTVSCDNGKEVRYNVQNNSCKGACDGNSKCGSTAGGASCGSVPNGGFIRRGECTWDGANKQCVRENFKCDNGKESSPYTTYDASCAGQCGQNVAATRNPDQVCLESGGTPSGACTGGGSTCKYGPNVGNRCCYGDSQGKHDGACYQGSTPQVPCNGTTITNNSGHDIVVNRYSGGNTCPRTNPTGTEILKNGQTANANGCEQIDAPGYCGACVNLTSCGGSNGGKHLECVNYACKQVDGSGSNTCANDRDCQVSQQTVCDRLTASTNYGNTPLTVSFGLSGHTVGGGSISKYRFDFGDGESTGNQNSNSVSHTYNNMGTYTIRGYVTDDRNNTVTGGGCLATVSTVDRPTFKHSTCDSNNRCTQTDCPDRYTSCASTCGKDEDCQPGNQYSVCDSLVLNPNYSNSVPVTVTANLFGHTVNGGSINQYRFNFGDGTGDQTQGGNSLQHTFTSKGSYVVNGYVIDNRGNVSGGCQAVMSIRQPQVLSYRTPKTMPKTGPETDALLGVSILSGMGYLLTKAKLSLKGFRLKK